MSAQDDEDDEDEEPWQPEPIWFLIYYDDEPLPGDNPPTPYDYDDDDPLEEDEWPLRG